MLENKNYAPQCAEMIEKQLRRRGISDAAVLAAMTAVPRHEFVPPELRSHAYDDLPLPIGGGQTISQPYMVAAMTAALHLQPGDRVLEIGTGCGYQAAVLSRLVKEVFTIERRPELAATASATLARLGSPTRMFTAATAHWVCRNSPPSTPSWLPRPLLGFRSRSLLSWPKAAA